jgi:hypothetical protein
MVDRWTDVPAGTINAAQQRFWVATDDRADTIAERMKVDPAYVQRLALAARFDGYSPIANQGWARDIMGKNFFGVEEGMMHFSIDPTERELAALATIPFAPETLTACKDTHLLVAIFQLSVNDIMAKTSSWKTEMFRDRGVNSWARKQRFAEREGGAGWWLVRKTPLPGSSGKTFEEQQGTFPGEEVIPFARVLLYAIFGYCLKTKEHLFETQYVRCADLCSRSGEHVYVGGFGDGIHIYHCEDDDLDSRWQVSSARRP